MFNILSVHIYSIIAYRSSSFPHNPNDPRNSFSTLGPMDEACTFFLWKKSGAGTIKHICGNMNFVNEMFCVSNGCVFLLDFEVEKGKQILWKMQKLHRLELELQYSRKIRFFTSLHSKLQQLSFNSVIFSCSS